MKKIMFAVIAALILLTGCSKYRITLSDKQSAELETKEAAQSETESKTLTSEKKFIQLTMVSVETGFALTEDNQVYKTEDGGINWTDFYTINTDKDVIDTYPAIYAVNDHTLYITAYYDDQTNFISTADDGKTWTATAVDSEISWVKDDISSYCLDFIDENNGCLLIDSTPGAGQMLKVLYRTTDAGVNWDMVVGDDGGKDSVKEIISSGVSGFPNGISFMNPQNGWIVCGSNGAPPYGAYFYKTNNGGKIWSNVEIPEIPQEFSEYDSSELYIGALAPSFYGSDNNSGKMILIFHVYEQTIKDAAYIYSYNESETWMLEGKCNTLISNINFIDDNNGYGLNEEGNICKTNDGGLTWNSQVIKSIIR